MANNYDDQLAALAKKVESKVQGSNISPYSLHKEQTKSVQVRLTQWKKLKMMSVEKEIKLVDLVGQMIDFAMQSEKFKQCLLALLHVHELDHFECICQDKLSILYLDIQYLGQNVSLKKQDNAHTRLYHV